MIDIKDQDLLVIRNSYPKIYDSIEELVDEKGVEKFQVEFEEYLNNIDSYDIDSSFRDFLFDKYKNLIFELGIEKMLFFGDTEEQTNKFKEVWLRNKNWFEGCVFRRTDFTIHIKDLEKDTEEQTIEKILKNKKEIKKKLTKEFKKELLGPKEMELINKREYKLMSTEEEVVKFLLSDEDVIDFVSETLRMTKDFDRTIKKDFNKHYSDRLYFEISNLFLVPRIGTNIDETTALRMIVSKATSLAKKFEDLFFSTTYAAELTFFKIFVEASREYINSSSQEAMSSFIYHCCAELYGRTYESYYDITMYDTIEELIYQEEIDRIEVARKVYFGDIKSWTDDYFYIDGEGNISSMCEDHFVALMKEMAGEVLERLKEMAETDDYLKNFFEEREDLLRNVEREWLNNA